MAKDKVETLYLKPGYVLIHPRTREQIDKKEIRSNDPLLKGQEHKYTTIKPSKAIADAKKARGSKAAGSPADRQIKGTENR